MSCSNSAVAPLVIPYGSVSLPGNTIPVQRGLEVQLGNPPQTLSFLPSLIDDSFAIANPSNCDGGNSNRSCAGFWGGLYTSSDSNTYYPVSEQAWNGTHITPDGRTATTFFNEEVRIADKTIFGFPVTQFDPSIFPNMVGINENSTFLNISVDSGLAPTSSFGLWAGRSASNNEVDGSLVIGGYDQARVSGDFATFNATSGCLACMYVKSIDYNAPDGTNTPLLPADAAPLSVSLSPEVPDMELPPIAFNNLVQTTAATQFVAENKWGWPSGTKLGDVTVSFYNGHEVKIPAEELWQSYKGYDDSGDFKVLNDSITISRLVNRTDGLTPNLGFPFFSSIYMTFHPQEKYFALATPVRDANVQQSIVSFCKTDGTSNNETNPSSDGGSGGNSHVGALAGGIVGGVAGLALLAALSWFLLKRRRQAKIAAFTGATVEDEKHGDVKESLMQSYSSTSGPSELPQYTKANVNSGQQVPLSEMAVTERPPELSGSYQPIRHEMAS